MTDDPPTQNSSRPRRSLHSPTWQRPEGVSAGNWDYIRSAEIARGYLEFLSADPLNSIDGEVIARYLGKIEATRPDPVIVDFGCGNGRSLIPLIKKGYLTVGIDLSRHMLDEFADACRWESEVVNEPQLVLANLVALNCFRDDIGDLGLCLFSTLGMIQNRAYRVSVLKHARRLIKPGGYLILHAHNLWFQVASWVGAKWFLQHLWKCSRGRAELGDRSSNYRGLKNVLIHNYRRRELQADLRSAGWEPSEWFGIRPGDHRPTYGLPWFSDFRLVGWLVVCHNAC